jgi:hypothetical protein
MRVTNPDSAANDSVAAIAIEARPETSVATMIEPRIRMRSGC